MGEYGFKLGEETSTEEAAARSLCKAQWLVLCHMEQMEDQDPGVTGKRLSSPEIS